ncbi:MAG TPA: homoserine kinase [Acidothermaceae bacterium]|nr:homoserine kinase [Acidothermaceae bacterium]
MGVSFRAAPARVRVPATSANLGPGFDSFGLALALYDDVVVRVAESGLTVDVAGEGADEVRRDKRNLVVQAVRATFDALGGQPRGLEIVCANRIPHGRGLGSSAAAIVAGVVAARELVLGGSERLPADAVLQLAAQLEGHPDNVAACLAGGFTMAWTEPAPVTAGTISAPERLTRALHLAVHKSIAAVVFVPDTKSSTTKARKLLPESVPHDAAAANAARAALLSQALTRRPELLFVATEDSLHQPYRASAMPRSAALLARLREAGIAAVISGAGPSVLALATTAQAESVAQFDARWFTASQIAIDTEGARVLPLDG